MKDLKNKDAYGHVRGESIFVDDINTQQGTLTGLVFDSPIAHGSIKSLDLSQALALEGVQHIFTAKDIPGENQIGGIIPDEPLLAAGEVHYMGQPIAFIVATSDKVAKKARSLITIELEEWPVITTARDAFDKGSFINAPRTFSKGDTQIAFSNCDYVIKGSAYSNGQEHLYLETQGAYVVPMEDGHIKIMSSTQGPTQVQKAAAKVLGLPMHKIEVEVTRLGGGFGGKEDQATPWAVMTALAAQQLKKPVKFILNRHDDLRMTGKRHPYDSDFTIGLDKDLKIKAYEVRFLQNSGAAADLSPAIAERTLFHATNAYYVENVQTTVYSCKTNLPPNTAFRGFGGPQGMFVMESAIAKAARHIGVSVKAIQSANLLKDGDEFSYGQIAKNVEANNSWETAINTYQFHQLEAEIKDFNNQNSQFKKGISLMPICFGISFTNTPMNHARALVHIYQDGSIGISTGAVEMGQGVNTKMLQIAAITFGLPPEYIKIESTNTTRVANTSPSAASATADLNGKALLMACNALADRLLKVAGILLGVEEQTITLHNGLVFVKGEPSKLKWKELINHAFLQRVCLSEQAHYATPEIEFDKTKEKGHPFAYHVYGTAITIVTVDCLRGTYTFDAVKIAHDFGQSMNKPIDYGQIEGGLAQGIGWMTLEEIAYAPNGRLLSNALSTYKVPDVFSGPAEVDIIPIETDGHQLAILKSKAVGEPPLMYGIGAYFAIQNAMQAFNPQLELKFDAPMTAEKVLITIASGLGKNQ